MFHRKAFPYFRRQTRDQERAQKRTEQDEHRRPVIPCPLTEVALPRAAVHAEAFRAGTTQGAPVSFSALAGWFGAELRTTRDRKVLLDMAPEH